jgi:release factor glutamine methyltransferase
VVLGWVEFCGLRLAVAPGVFVPRRRTSLLVREALAVLAVRDVPVADPRDLQPERHGRRTLVDLCCGVGAIGAAVLAERPDVEVHAADVDPVAAACARTNLGGRGEVHIGDLYDALPRDLAGRVDVLVANAPYVPTDAIARMPPEARDHEPRHALDGGPDGVDVHRRIVAGAGDWLAPGGHLLIETGRIQSRTTGDLMAEAGLGPRIVTDDDLDATVVVAIRRPLGRSVDSSGE